MTRFDIFLYGHSSFVHIFYTKAGFHKSMELFRNLRKFLYEFKEILMKQSENTSLAPSFGASTLLSAENKH